MNIIPRSGQEKNVIYIYVQIDKKTVFSTMQEGFNNSEVYVNQNNIR